MQINYQTEDNIIKKEEHIAEETKMLDLPLVLGDIDFLIGTVLGKEMILRYQTPG